MRTTTIIPVNVISVPKDGETTFIQHQNQWVQFHDSGMMYGYSISADKRKVTKTFEWPYDVNTFEAAVDKISRQPIYSVTATIDGVETSIVAQKTGGCACSDPRKPIQDISRMEALAARLSQSTTDAEFRTATLLETPESANQRRIQAKAAAQEELRRRAAQRRAQ